MDEPALPPPDVTGTDGESAYSIERLRAYALQAVADATIAERAACAELCRTMNHGAFGSPDFLLGVQAGSMGCANAIEKRK